jgi:hypothetical protein
MVPAGVLGGYCQGTKEVTKYLEGTIEEFGGGHV